MPPINITDAPDDTTVDCFVQANADSLNQGVFDEHGNWLSPTFDHHVDDLMSADMQNHLHQTIAASVLSLYEVLIYPTNYTPDPLSREKFVAAYTHHCKIVGWIIDTRLLCIGLPQYKRDQIVLLLARWSPK
jgi:hypothetical protein